jgi:L-amino acid N-acyltransferase YncA
MKQVGFKFGCWLDVVFMELILRGHFSKNDIMTQN